MLPALTRREFRWYVAGLVAMAVGVVILVVGGARESWVALGLGATIMWAGFFVTVLAGMRPVERASRRRAGER